MCEEYWPTVAGDNIAAGKLVVRLTSENKKEHFSVRKFEISKEQVYANIVSDGTIPGSAPHHYTVCRDQRSVPQ